MRTLIGTTVAFRRIGVRWWAVMLALAALPNAAAIALQTAVAEELPSSVTEADLTLLSPLAIIVFAFAAGFAEEPGWRGYALERLGRRPLLLASLLVGLGWSLWHLPYFLIDGTFQNELGFGWQFWWFLLQILPSAVLLGWVFVRTGHLVAAAVALHASRTRAASCSGSRAAGVGLRSPSWPRWRPPSWCATASSSSPA